MIALNDHSYRYACSHPYEISHMSYITVDPSIEKFQFFENLFIYHHCQWSHAGSFFAGCDLFVSNISWWVKSQKSSCSPARSHKKVAVPPRGAGPLVLIYLWFNYISNDGIGIRNFVCSHIFNHDSKSFSILFRWLQTLNILINSQIWKSFTAKADDFSWILKFF